MRKLIAFVLSILMSLPALPLPVQAAVQEVSMYRLYNPNSGEHFYTAQPGERDMLKSAGWQYEGIAWIAPSTGNPVYRLYNKNAGDHHYTLDAHERDVLVGLGWNSEGTGWYSDPGKTVSVYRQYNPNAKAGAHNFTTSKGENDALAAIGWKPEGIAWYALKEGTPAPAVQYGPLHVQDSQLVDENNKPVVLQGFSTFGLNYAPQYVDENVFRFLRNTMNSQVIRLALYTQEYGGYCSGGDQNALKALIDKGVKATKATGQYCIIDWHILSDGNPNTHVQEAKSFFQEMSSKYRNEDHIFYEICNEPNGVDWNTIRSYASQIIPIIRKNDPNAIILVGTPTWSQDVDVAAQSPLSQYSNIMYTLHFYAATHKEGIRNKLKAAHDRGLPVFVSEFGISSADGNGSLDQASGNAWISLLNEYGISRIGWALSNKNEASALFKPGTSTSLSLNDLSPSGQWFYSTYSKTPQAPLPDKPAPTPDQPSLPPVPSADPIPSVKQVNSWNEGDYSCYQFELTVKNPGSASLSSWSVSIPFNAEFSISSSWNGQFSILGKTLKVTPMDYNIAIPGNGSAENIGFILKTRSSTLKPLL